MIDAAQQKIDTVLIPTGYTATAALSSVPFWPESFHGWLSILAVFLAVLVGGTTTYLNVVSIRDKKRRKITDNLDKKK